MFQKFKPFFDLKVRSLEDAIALLLGTFVFGVIVFNAYFLPITYDEAYSYLNTGRIQNVWKIYLFRIANTHVLNSLLMTLSTLFFPYVDFALRLPSVIISFFYISTAISFSKKYQNGLLLLGPLLLFYYVLGYFSLARGYGMSAAFILAAIFVYTDKRSFKEYYLWVVYLFLLAIYSSYVAIVPFVAMMAYMFVFDFKFKLPTTSTKQKRWIVFLTVLAFYGFYSVTKAGKPLYGAYTQTFFEAIPQDVVLRFLDINYVSLQLVTIVSIVLVVAILLVFFFFKRKSPVGIITIATFMAVFLASWIGDKPLPTGRVLVPYWPLLVFTVFELLEFITIKLKIPRLISRAFNFSLLALLLFNFQSQIHFADRLPVQTQIWKTPIYILSGYGKEIYPHDEYYLEKDWKHRILQQRLEQMEPTEVRNLSKVTCKTYSDLGLITINFSGEATGKLIYRQVLENGEITYQDTIQLGGYLYPVQENYPLLLPFPRFGGDELKIGDVDGDWSTTYQIPEGMKDFFPPEKRHAI